MTLSTFARICLMLVVGSSVISGSAFAQTDIDVGGGAIVVSPGHIRVGDGILVDGDNVRVGAGSTSTSGSERTTVRRTVSETVNESGEDESLGLRTTREKSTHTVRNTSTAGNANTHWGDDTAAVRPKVRAVSTTSYRRVSAADSRAGLRRNDSRSNASSTTTSRTTIRRTNTVSNVNTTGARSVHVGDGIRVDGNEVHVGDGISVDEHEVRVGNIRVRK